MTAGNGGPAFQHWLSTGKYLWQGKEYTDPPHELEVDLRRGVLYVHSILAGQSVLRVCRIPDNVLWMFASGAGTAYIDLKTVAVRGQVSGSSGTLKGTIEKQPVFLDIPESYSVVDGGIFSIADEAGLALFSFSGVPGSIMKRLWYGEFADITIGFTGHG